jgi:hypothetical protein
MDRVTRVILAVAVAVLFPVLIYFTANTFLPDNASTPKPTHDYHYPASTACTDDYSPHNPDSCSYEYRDDYGRTNMDNEHGVMRAGLAISLSLVGLVVALSLRRIPELLVGLTTGGAVANFGAVTYLATVRDPSSEPVYQFVFWLAVFAFLALVSIVYTADHSIPRPIVRVAAKKPKVS